MARSFIEAVDHWVAFGLLAAVGVKMIVDALQKNGEEKVLSHRLPIVTFFLLGIATSIDAFAVGIGLGLEHPRHTVLWVVLLIGAVTLAVSLLGVSLGKKRVPIPERTATILAGAILIALGAKILVEHLLG